MPSEQRHLRDAVISGVKDVDRVFRRLSDDVLRIMRTMPSPLTRLAKIRAMRLIDRVLDQTFGLVQRSALVSELFTVITRATETTALGVFDRTINRVRDAVESVRPGWWTRIVSTQPPTPFTKVVTDLNGPVTVRQRAIRANGFDPDRLWVRGDGTPYRLSQRVWRGGREVRREIDAILQDGIRNGTSAVDLAAKLERYLNPDKAPLSYRKDGRIVRKNTTRTPYGKAGSSYARTLARTEITRAHGLATIEAAKITPGCLGVQWRLSGSHPAVDPCNDSASRHSDGMEPGQYRANEVPRYPNHPQCICTLLPVVISRRQMLDELVATYGV